MLHIRISALLVAVVVIVALLLPTVSSLKCYQCNSHLDDDCLHIEPNSTKAQRHLKECDIDPSERNQTAVFCRKIDQTVLGVSHRRVVRRCGWEQSPKPCYHFEDGDHFETVCQCFHDACNSGPGAPSAMRTFLTATLVTGLLLALAR